MSGTHQYGTDELLRYVFGELGEDDRPPLEQHVAGCADCRGFISFVSTFNDGLRKAVAARRRSGEPHPETFLIAALEANALDEPAASRVRSHVLFCESCLDDFLSIRRVMEEQARPASWPETLERVRSYLVDLAKNYGVGTVLGPAVILGEAPALAVRGAASTSAYSKSMEIAVGQNTYSVEISLTEDGRLSFDVAGSRVREKAPAALVLRAVSGEELAATETDNFGNGELSMLAAQAANGACVLCVAVGGNEECLLLEIPTVPRPA